MEDLHHPQFPGSRLLKEDISYNVWAFIVHRPLPPWIDVSGKSIIQYKVSDLEVVGEGHFVMFLLDSLLVKMVVADGCQTLLINEV